MATSRIPFALLSLAVGCASAPPAKVEAPTPAPVEAAAPPEEAVVAPAAPEPSAEELAAAEAEKARLEAEQKALAEREALLANQKIAIERLTPELREQAKKLADQNFATGKAALKAAAAGSHRAPENVARDKDRHPVETLEFFGFKPTLTVLEYGPGGGWYTEILAPALAKKGKLLATNTDPNGPITERSSFYGERFKLFLETSPELYGKVETVLIDGKAPKLDVPEGSVDMVLAFRTLHGMATAGTLNAWLEAFHNALKNNGVLAIEQHRSKPDATFEEAAKAGYLPEKWVIEQVEAAGFKLAGKSEINANPRDTKDHPSGVWSLPPSLREGGQDRAKYEAIGESDRMTLKFVKTKKKS